MSKIGHVTGSGVGSYAVVREFTAGAAITALNWVGFDLSASGGLRAEKVVQGGANAYTFGVALDSASAAGDVVRVVVRGYVEGALTGGSVTSGSALAAGASGIVANYANTDVLPIIGVALEDDGVLPNAATACDVYVWGIAE